MFSGRTMMNPVSRSSTLYTSSITRQWTRSMCSTTLSTWRSITCTCKVTLNRFAVRGGCRLPKRYLWSCRRFIHFTCTLRMPRYMHIIYSRICLWRAVKSSMPAAALQYILLHALCVYRYIIHCCCSAKRVKLIDDRARIPAYADAPLINIYRIRVAYNNIYMRTKYNMYTRAPPSDGLR